MLDGIYYAILNKVISAIPEIITLIYCHRKGPTFYVNFKHFVQQ